MVKQKEEIIMENEMKDELMDNELDNELENGVDTEDFSYTSFFVVKPKPKPVEDASIAEVKPEAIPTMAAEEMNQATMELPEEIEELAKPTPTVDELEEMEEIEIIPNGYSGMYILITILMVAMISISVLGIVLS